MLRLAWLTWSDNVPNKHYPPHSPCLWIIVSSPSRSHLFVHVCDNGHSPLSSAQHDFINFPSATAVATRRRLTSRFGNCRSPRRSHVAGVSSFPFASSVTHLSSVTPHFHGGGAAGHSHSWRRRVRRTRRSSQRLIHVADNHRAHQPHRTLLPFSRDKGAFGHAALSRRQAADIAAVIPEPSPHAAATTL